MSIFKTMRKCMSANSQPVQPKNRKRNKDKTSISIFILIRSILNIIITIFIICNTSSALGADTHTGASTTPETSVMNNTFEKVETKSRTSDASEGGR